MDDIDLLIKTVRGGDEEAAEEAASKLAEIGMPSVPAILSEIRKGSRQFIIPLDRILLRIKNPEIIPIFIKLMDDENTVITMTAFEALGQSKDERALKPLLNRLTDSIEPETMRSLASNALGELGYSQAIEILLKTVDDACKNKLPKLALSAIEALAKLGNHEKAHIAVTLISYMPNRKNPDYDPAYDDSSIIRSKAAEALQYAVAPGMFPALVKALSDPDPEVRNNALDAIFYLGAKESIAELISHIKDKVDYVANNKRVRVNDLTGQAFQNGVDATELKKWWRQNEKEYAENICYRMGKPIWLPVLNDLLEKSSAIGRVSKEVKIITGIDFGYDPYLSDDELGELPQRAREWWKKEGQRFERGGLYKYGFKQDLKSIF